MKGFRRIEVFPHTTQRRDAPDEGALGPARDAEERTAREADTAQRNPHRIPTFTLHFTFCVLSCLTPLRSSGNPGLDCASLTTHQSSIYFQGKRRDRSIYPGPGSLSCRAGTQNPVSHIATRAVNAGRSSHSLAQGCSTVREGGRMASQRRQKSLFGATRRYRKSLSVGHAVPYVTPLCCLPGGLVGWSDVAPQVSTLLSSSTCIVNQPSCVG